MSDWSTVYTRYRQDVLGFLQRRLWGERELAEDLCQETFSRAMGAAVEMHDLSRVRSYLLRTANNLLIGHFRKRDRLATESELGPDRRLESHVDKRIADPLADTETAQLRAKVDQLVAELGDDLRIAFERGVLQRVPYSEIAEEQDWTVAKVKVCVYRARKHLMAGLQDYR
jgi:RNA polymerase sigma-70 factor (ECF subfamily)